MAFDKLFETIKIGRMTVKNRYTYAPCNYLYQSWDGMINEGEIAYCVARSRDVGFYTYGAVCVVEEEAYKTPFPMSHLFKTEHLAGMAQLAESIHLCGAKAIMQVFPGGGRHRRGYDIQPISPSGVTYDLVKSYFGHRPEWSLITKRLKNTRFLKEFSQMPVPRAMETREVEKMVAEYGENLRLAVLAGWDGVELHLCHGYLVDEFRSPIFNMRTDKYGGNEENRNRFILELTEAAIKNCKEDRPDFVVGVRISSDQYEGFTFEETLRLAKQLEEIGIDYYSVTRGLPEGPKERYDQIWSDGGFLQWSKELKKILKVPIVTANIHDPKLAEQAVIEGWTDIVALGRPLVADPDYVRKVKEARVNDIVKCTRENMCIASVFCGGLPGRCIVNPEVGFEKYNPKYLHTQGFKGIDAAPYILRKEGK